MPWTPTPSISNLGTKQPSSSSSLMIMIVCVRTAYHFESEMRTSFHALQRPHRACTAPVHLIVYI